MAAPPPQIPPWFAALTNKQQTQLRDWISIEYQCDRCRVFFRECNNIGQWKCLCHTLPFNYNSDGIFHRKGQWDCCGRPMYELMPSTNGCTPCDHLPVMEKTGQVVAQQPVLLIKKTIIDNILPKELRPPKPESFDLKGNADSQGYYHISRQGPRQSYQRTTIYGIKL
jgi:hypothetical protein